MCGEHAHDIIQAADEIRESVDSRWLIDPSHAGPAALGDAAARIGISSDDLADLATLLWRHEHRR